MPDTLTLDRPLDMHIHFRDGAIMRDVVPWTARAFAGAVAMFTVVDRRRRSAEIAAQEVRDDAAQDLISAVEAVANRNFVAVVPEGWLVNTPDLDRLRVLEESLALSDPDVPLLHRIQGTIRQTEADLQALLQRTDLAWSDAGLAIDVNRYEHEIDVL